MSSNNTSKRNIKRPSESEDYPDLNLHTEKILVFVKKSPVLSKKYRELVCTAGITENRKFVRLYPIDFRYLPPSHRYTKYQWIEIDIEKHQQDKRLESYRPNRNTIRLLGKIGTERGWQERKDIFLPLVSKSLEEIQEEWRRNNTSIGLFKPKEIFLKMEKSSETWGEKELGSLNQGVLIGPKTKPLDKIPYKFSYQFSCDDHRCPSHMLTIIDWELSELYRNMKARYGYSMDLVLEKMKETWEDRMWRSGRDSYLIVGTHHVFKTPMVLGVFWPPQI